MHPPLNSRTETLAEWMARLKTATAKQVASQTEAQAEQAVKRVVMLAEVESRRPMIDQIMSWWNSLPPDVQARRRWQLAEIVPHLRGRYRATPHRGVVTRALREIGWTEQRDWTVRGRGLRYWTPPGRN